MANINQLSPNDIMLILLAITFGAITMAGWLGWLIEAAGHRREARRNEILRLHISALEKMLGEYDSEARARELLFSQSKAIVKAVGRLNDDGTQTKHNRKTPYIGGDAGKDMPLGTRDIGNPIAGISK